MFDAEMFAGLFPFFVIDVVVNYAHLRFCAFFKYRRLIYKRTVAAQYGIRNCFMEAGAIYVFFPARRAP